MQTSGVVLDVYDDVGGSVLRQMFPTREDVPGLVKQAHALSPAERAHLPDDAFALVLLNGDEKLRKFACVDAGNTALSVLYFVKNAHKLPEVARQTAAENLKVACGWYGLDVPVEIEKEAGILGALNPLKNPGKAISAAITVPSIVQGTGGEIKRNLAKVRAGEQVAGARGGLAALSPEGMEHLAAANFDALLLREAFSKNADVTATVDMPLTADHKKLSLPASSSIRKTAHMSPVVDVTGLNPSFTAQEKKAHYYALDGQYPLDSYTQVKQASDFFATYGRRLDPADRHTFCTNLVKRASDLSIPLPPIVRKYGSEKYASISDIELALDTRRSLLVEDRDAVNVLDKIAEAITTIPPDEFCGLLTVFDRSYDLDHHYDANVMDPYYSTYGFTKTAEDEDAEFTDTIGNLHVSANDLLALKTNKKWLTDTFGEDFCEEFCHDPISIYKSMPVEQKKLIIRAATDNSPV